MTYNMTKHPFWLFLCSKAISDNFQKVNKINFVHISGRYKSLDIVKIENFKFEKVPVDRFHRLLKKMLGNKDKTKAKWDTYKFWQCPYIVPQIDSLWRHKDGNLSQIMVSGPWLYVLYHEFYNLRSRPY